MSKDTANKVKKTKDDKSTSKVKSKTVSKKAKSPAAKKKTASKTTVTSTPPKAKAPREWTGTKSRIEGSRVSPARDIGEDEVRLSASVLSAKHLGGVIPFKEIYNNLLNYIFNDDVSCDKEYVKLNSTTVREYFIELRHTSFKVTCEITHLCDAVELCCRQFDNIINSDGDFSEFNIYYGGNILQKISGEVNINELSYTISITLEKISDHISPHADHAQPTINELKHHNVNLFVVSTDDDVETIVDNKQKKELREKQDRDSFIGNHLIKWLINTQKSIEEVLELNDISVGEAVGYLEAIITHGFTNRMCKLEATVLLHSLKYGTL